MISLIKSAIPYLLLIGLLMLTLFTRDAQQRALESESLNKLDSLSEKTAVKVGLKEVEKTTQAIDDLLGDM